MSIGNDDFTDVVSAALARQQQLNDAANTVGAAQASAISGMAATYPTVDPGIAYALGRSGITPSDPTAAYAATSDAVRKAANGQVAPPGSPVTGSQLAKAHSSGGFFGSIGHAIGNVGHALSNANNAIGVGLADAGNAVKTGVEDVTRVGTAGLMLPPDLIQAVARDATNVIRDPNNKAGTSFLQALQDNIKSTQIGALIEQGIKTGDTGGSGFFFNPHSAAGQAQVKAQHDIATINGHSVTVGRELAASVSEPGTRPYNIMSGLLDFTVQLAGGKPAGKVGDVLRARKVLSGGEAPYLIDEAGHITPATPENVAALAAKAKPVIPGEPAASAYVTSGMVRGQLPQLKTDYGLVDGVRQTVLPQKAVTWLDSRAGNRFADFAASSHSFNDIWDATGRQLPVDVVTQLVDTNNPGQVKQIIAGELGQTVRTAPGVSAAQATAAAGGRPGIIGQAGMAVRSVSQSPLLTMMPHRSLDLSNPDRAVEDFDRFQKIASVFTPAEISANNERLARSLAGSGGGGAAFQTVMHVTDTVGDAMKKMGVKPEYANRAVQSWRNTVNDLRHFNIDDIGNNVDIPGVIKDDQGNPVPSPHLFVEYLNNNIPLPDIREIRTAVSKLRNITDSTPGRLATDAGDWINNQVFKPWVLLRGAWPIRVLGEEQARMAAAGYATLTKDPASYIAMMVGSKMPKTRALLAKMGKDSLTADVTGTPWEEQASNAIGEDATEFAQAQWHRASGLIDSSNGIITRHFPLFTKGQDPGFHQAWADELRKLNADPVSRRLAQALDQNTPAPAAVDDLSNWMWAGKGASLRGSLSARWLAQASRYGISAGQNPFTTRTGVQDYVQSIYDRIITKTSGHPQLVSAAATGRVMGKNLTSGGDVNPKAVDALHSFTDYAPNVATGPMRIYRSAGSAGSRVSAGYQKAVQFGFDWMMSKPSSYLSRSPVFKQAYQNRIRELAPYMDAKSATKAATNADQAGAATTAAALRAGGKGTLTLDNADLIAKRYALNEVQTLLYGESKKSNFFDAFRILFPFGDAWREVVTRWAKLASQNPAVPLRGAQIVNGARQSGITYTDPQTGQEMFVYPGSGMITKALTGVPAPMAGSASGLNMVTASLLPGFGPAVQIAAGQMIPNVPATKSLRDFLMPFGAGDTSGGIASQLSSTFIPAWLKKFQTASSAATPAQQRQLMETTGQVMSYLYSTGKYDTSTPDGQQKLIADARKAAVGIWRLRGMAQFGAPSAPEPQISALDKDGKLHTIYALANAYHSLQDQDAKNGTHIATQKFMEQYGPLAVMATDAATSGPFPATTSVYDFAKANPDLVKKYPTLYGYFAPAGGVFSQAEYNAQLASGERVTRTPQEQADTANQRMATMLYDQAKAQVAGRTDKDAANWLRQAKDKITAAYPTFGLQSAPPDPGTLAQQIQRLTVAVKDPQVASTDAGKGLVLYMQARDKAIAAAQAAGLSTFASAKSAANIRDWLQNVAVQIEQAYPDFANLYDQVLSREMPKVSP